MAYPPYLREKARTLRREKSLTIDELAERLALSRTTIYYWVRDLPIERSWRQTRGQRLGNAAMQAKYRRLRAAAYAEGRETFDALAKDPLFRDFVALYIAEGYKRNRNTLVLCNSDPAVIAVADTWLAQLSTRPRTYSIQYHADQDLEALRTFWGHILGIDRGIIRLLRKSNSNQLTGRTWRSEHGVLTVTVHDTLLRARLQGWIDCIREEWLISATAGV
jgi:transcriptional regulator with XRE-family HTH domain